MQKNRIKTVLSVILAVCCLAAVSVDVYQQSVSLRTLGAWIVLLGSFFFITRGLLHKQPASHHVSCVTKKEKIILLLLGIETLVSLWWFGIQPTHFHYDEFITATTSYTLPIFQKINWFGVFPNIDEWVCQFPILFHILQYPFIRVFPTVMGVRMSTWPYTVGTVCIVYLMTRHITKRKVLAFFAANAFIFIAPQQYIGSLGLHFHAGIFFFMLSIYSFMKISDEQRPLDVFVLGISAACCYLGYTAAYIIAPLLIMMGVIRMLLKPKKKLLIAYAIASIIALFAVTPWIIYAVRYNNFFLQRINQINVFTGTWIESQNKVTIQNITTLLPTRILTILSSFLRDNKSGVGEYFFGSMALLDPFSVILLCSGVVYFMILIVRKKFNAFVLVTSMVLLFITSTVLTQNPTPFHRLSIDFPFVGICIGCGMGTMYILWSKYSTLRTVGYAISILLLIAYIFVNTYRAGIMVENDKTLRNMESLSIAWYVKAYTHPGDSVQIIAFPQYHLGKELFFRTNGTIRYITDRTIEVMDMPEPQLIIVQYPNNETLSAVKKRYPNAARLYDPFTLHNHAVFINQ